MVDCATCITIITELSWDLRRNYQSNYSKNE